MQEYQNHPPELFMSDEEQKEHETNKEFHKRVHEELIAQMDERLEEDESLVMKKRTFFEDSLVAKLALAEAKKLGRK